MLHRTRLVIVASGLLLTGCLDLDVSNPNRPDMSRVTKDPVALQTMVGGNFTQLFWPSVQNGYPNLALGAMADILTSGFLDFGIYDMAAMPRAIYDNSPTYRRRDMAEVRWYRNYEILSNVNPVLNQIEAGLIIRDPQTKVDLTPQIEAFARLMQGLAHGYLALHFDKSVIFDETMDPELLDPTAYSTYKEVRDAAIAQLDEAIRVASSHSFTIPGEIGWINGVSLTSTELIRIANSYVARLLAYTPRSPEERAEVDWTEVIRRVDAGITTDFAPQGRQGVLESEFRFRLARTRTADTPGDFIRLHYRLVGPGDISGNYQNWIAQPINQRTPFRMTSPDRRIQGADDARQAPLGQYFGYNAQTIFSASRGTYVRSYYFYHRLGTGTDYFASRQPTMTVAEMDLLKAEALVRLNRADESLPIINATRVANGQLPPVTIDGPPSDARCVPRRDDGSCGSLWDALRYEKFIETVGFEGGMSFYDARGWGFLPERTHIHFPVPGRELETLGLPNYTFGGGANDSAPAPSHEKCPVALPRCT